MKAPGFWARSNPTPLAFALAPFGAIYGSVTAWRMARPGLRIGAPVICVGNFVAGGAGKTPAAIAIAHLLRGMGEQVAFLSRGYRGSGRTEVIDVDPGVHRAEEVGDEPLLLARAAPCFVARDRRIGARAAIAAGASVLVLDDGLQNPSLTKDLVLALIDGGFGFGNGLCVPAGPLRAPLAAQLSYATAVIVVGEPSDAGRKALALVAGPLALKAHIEPDPGVAATLRGKNVLAFAGIGRPGKFFATLEALGARVVVARGFPDHQRYRPDHLDSLIAEAGARDLRLVTTEKDFVRLPPAYAAKVLALPIALRFEDPNRIISLLASALAEWRDSR